ncbi:MAG: polymer-forming cytoskeletal protein [Tissierellia bacterium]|nr:polymer-forming cytoskeletal protein [Tissierellia bacterium]
MFGKRKEEIPAKSVDIDSLIGENMTVVGTIKGNGNIRVDGTIEGDIAYDGDISLGEQGKISGDISCNNLTVAGSIDGNIEVKDSLILLSSGVIMGDMEVKSLVIHEDARFEGNCKMLNSSDNIKIPEPNLFDEDEGAQ